MEDFDEQLAKFVPANPRPSKSGTAIDYSQQTRNREGGIPRTVTLEFFFQKIKFFSGNEVDPQIIKDMVEFFDKRDYAKEADVQGAVEKLIRKFCKDESECAYQSWPRSDSNRRVPDAAVFSKTILKDNISEGRDFVDRYSSLY